MVSGGGSSRLLQYTANSEFSHANNLCHASSLQFAKSYNTTQSNLDSRTDTISPKTYLFVVYKHDSDDLARDRLLIWKGARRSKEGGRADDFNVVKGGDGLAKEKDLPVRMPLDSDGLKIVQDECPGYIETMRGVERLDH